MSGVDPIPTHFHEVFQPSIVGTQAYTFPATKVSDGCVPPEYLENDADLLFSSELAVSDALDVSDKLLGFLAPGFSLPELVRTLLESWPAPF
jgi:hypothetical protein